MKRKLERLVPQRLHRYAKPTEFWKTRTTSNVFEDQSIEKITKGRMCAFSATKTLSGKPTRLFQR